MYIIYSYSIKIQYKLINKLINLNKNNRRILEYLAPTFFVLFKHANISKSRCPGDALRTNCSTCRAFN